MSAASVSKLPTEINERHADAFRKLEPTICDVMRMATIARKLTFEMLDAAEGAQADLIELPVFAVQQLEQMIRELRQEYYRLGR